MNRGVVKNKIHHHGNNNSRNEGTEGEVEPQSLSTLELMIRQAGRVMSIGTIVTADANIPTHTSMNRFVKIKNRVKVWMRRCGVLENCAKRVRRPTTTTHHHHPSLITSTNIPPLSLE
eukprot:scaffold83_cov181-Amphora_coffeaeformis.AAC.4